MEDEKGRRITCRKSTKCEKKSRGLSLIIYKSSNTKENSLNKGQGYSADAF
jgi:hypothetical protein